MPSTTALVCIAAGIVLLLLILVGAYLLKALKVMVNDACEQYKRTRQDF